MLTCQRITPAPERFVRRGCRFFEPLSQKPQPVLVDCTLGLGGHALALLEAYPRLRVIGIDRDRQASTLASERLAAYTDRFNYCAGNFATILPTLPAPIDGILADLGVSSLQLDSPHRGFGFHSLNLVYAYGYGAIFGCF